MKYLCRAYVVLAIWLLLPGGTKVAVAAEQWQPLQIVDVGSHPWDASPRFKSKTKTFFKGPNDQQPDSTRTSCRVGT